MSGELFFRFVFLVGLGVAGWRIGLMQPAIAETWWVVAVAILSAGVGFGIAPYLTVRPFNRLLQRLRRVPSGVMVAGTVGLLVGLIAAALAAFPLSMLPGLWGKVLPIVVCIFIGYLGISVALLREKEMSRFLGSAVYAPRAGDTKGSPWSGQILVDTSAIIDGRIADISQTGFIQGTLLIPKFVLDELRHIADSSDPLRRNRGRRGLEMLSKLQKESDAPIQILETDVPDVQEVDSKLVELGKSLHCAIVTNDFNLNRVAELQGVRVLNVNELANAVKFVVLPGEEMRVRIIQEGKEAGQGVGFLDDGTMVVVDGGRRYLNTELDIMVTRVLQTAAGRMLFAQPANGARSERGRR